MQTLAYYFTAHIANVIFAVLLFAVGFILAKFLKKGLAKFIRTDKNRAFKNFIINFIYVSILILTIMLTLARLGVPVTSLIAVVGAASLAIGLALKDFLANIAAGILIVFLRPFKLGDSITIGNQTGTVIDINLFLTQLKSVTNQAIFIANRQVLNNQIINTTFHPTRRLDIKLTLDYTVDTKKATDILNELLKEVDDILPEPKPRIMIDQLGENGVDYVIRVWVQTSQYISIKSSLLALINDKLQEHQLSIAAPRRHTYFVKSET